RLNSDCALDPCWYLQQRGPQALSAPSAQIDPVDGFAIQRNDNGKADLLARVAGRYRFAPRRHAVVIAVKCLEDRHAATPSSRQRWISSTPSVRRARKKREMLSLAKSMSCSIQPRSRSR